MPRTRFRPETDGYAFTNTWTFDSTEIATLRSLVSDAVGAIEVALSPMIIAALGPALVAEAGVPFIGPWLVYETVTKANDAIVNAIVDAIEPGGYGLCGGMAFSSLDYFMRGWVLPRGNSKTDQPQRTSATGNALRSYLWSRLIDSIVANVGTFLQWMAILHFEGGPGATWLRDQTNVQLDTLRAQIDGGLPVTVGLIGTTWNPLANHQVLCYGYSDNSDGTTTLFLYDNNWPSVETTARLDFSGPALNATESIKPGDRGELRGLFCTSYTPKTPPKAVVLHSGLTLARPDTGMNQPIGLQLSAANDFFHNSPSLKLLAVGDINNVAQESVAQPIPEAGSRAFASQLTFDTAGKHKVTVVADLGPVAGIEITKQLPPEGNTQSPTATVMVFGDREIGPANYSECDVYNVMGTTMTYDVDASDMGPGVTLLWTALGATIQGSATSPVVQVKLPDHEGAEVTLMVKASLPDGSVSTGSATFWTITPTAAQLESLICEITHVWENAKYKPGPPDPGVIARINPGDLRTIYDSATALGDAANAALKTNAPVIIAPDLRTVGRRGRAGEPDR